MDDISAYGGDAENTAKYFVGQPNTAAAVHGGQSTTKGSVAMAIGLLGLFAMMAIAWALHDAQNARKLREQERQRRNG